MGFGSGSSQYVALLKKERLQCWFQRRRLVVQVLIPLVLGLVLVLTRIFWTEDLVPAKTNVDKAATLGDPFATEYGAELCADGGILAVAPPHGLGADFRKFLESRYKDLGMLPVGWPSLVPFADNEEVVTYLRKPDYGSAERPYLCAALLFEDQRYVLRMNGSLTGNRYAVCGGIDTRRVTEVGGLNMLLTKKDWYVCSGFLAIQRLADEFLIARQGRRHRVLGDDPDTAGAWDLALEVSPFPVPAYQKRTRQAFARDLVSVLLVLMFAYVSGSTVGGIVAERESRLLEMMRLLGMREGARQAALLGMAALLQTVLSVELALALKLGLFVQTSFQLLVGVLMSTGLAFAAFALAASACFDNSKPASLVTIVGVIAMSRLPIDSLAGCLLPPVGLVQILQRISELELAGTGLQWSSLDDPMGFDSSPGDVLLVIVLSLPAYLVMWIVLEKVVPHRYGQQTAACCKRRGSPAGQPRQEASAASAAGAAAEGADAGSSKWSLVERRTFTNTIADLQKLKKVYNVGGGRLKAVDGLCLSFVEGEILALLGHNGAGKSTTVGMISGLITPTEGSIDVCGKTMAEEPGQVQRLLGVCPQYDVLFDYLTVDEHLSLAATLRGLLPDGAEEVHATAQKLLEGVGLQNGTKGPRVPACQLSDGQRRALCVAMAFVGEPRFIVLDEPTSGMDPFVRRSMWELLKQQRTGRAICLSTHYMDEAEMLGDQVCILSAGRVQCYGSPLWLKSRLGSGYTMTLALSSSGKAGGNAAEKAATQALVTARQQLSTAEAQKLTITSRAGKEVSLRAPMEVAKQLPKVLRALETLSLGTWTVSVTTLEELFLRLADGQEVRRSEDSSPASSAAGSRLFGSAKEAAPPMDGIAGHARRQLSLNDAANMEAMMGELSKVSEERRPTAAYHARALLLKRYNYMRRNLSTLFCLIVMPVACNIFGMASTYGSFGNTELPPLELMGTTSVLNSRLADDIPRVVIPFGSPENEPLDDLQTEALSAGESAQLWNATDYLLTEKDLWRSEAEALPAWQVDATLIGGSVKQDDTSYDIQKYLQMKKKGAPEFVIKKVMTKDGVPASLQEDIIHGGGGGGGGGGSAPAPLRLRASVGLRDRMQVQINSASKEVALKWQWGRGTVRVDADREALAREELASCSLGSAAVMAATAAEKQLSNQTKELFSTMKKAGVPAEGLRAALEANGVAASTIDALVVSAEPDAIPASASRRLKRCAAWQAFAAALLDTRQEKPMSRYGAYYFEDLNPGKRRAAATVFYNTSGFPHSSAVFVGLLSRALAAGHNRDAKDVGVVNWPLPLTPWQESKLYQIASFTVTFFIVAGFVFLSSGTAADIVREQRNGFARQMQLAGVSVPTYWLGTLLADVMVMVVPVGVAIAFISFLHFVGVCDYGNNLVWANILIVAHVPAAIAQVYAFAPYLGKHTVAQTVVLVMNGIVGLVYAIISSNLQFVFFGTLGNTVGKILQHLAWPFPIFHLCIGLIFVPLTKPNIIAKDQVGKHPLAWEVLGEPLLAIATDLVVYMLIAIVRDGRVGKPRQATATEWAASAAFWKSCVADEVIKERRKADDAHDNEQSLVLEDICAFLPPRNATEASSTAMVGPAATVVPGGQILGVLGVAGSGKSILLKSLIGLLPEGSRLGGDARLGQRRLLGRHFLPGEVGSCQQENVLPGSLTTREAVYLFARIRGLRGKELVEQSMRVITSLDLAAFVDVPCDTLSGGNQRKVCVACALVGSPRLIVLDEPSAGLDPVARRSLWRTTTSCLSPTSVAVVATKSMEEATALCQKLLILDRRRTVRTVGTPLDIQARYGSGLELRLTLEPPTAEAVAERVKLQQANGALQQAAERQLQAVAAGELIASQGELLLSKLWATFASVGADVMLLEATSLSRVFRIREQPEADPNAQHFCIHSPGRQISGWASVQATPRPGFSGQSSPRRGISGQSSPRRGISGQATDGVVDLAGMYGGLAPEALKEGPTSLKKPNFVVPEQFELDSGEAKPLKIADVIELMEQKKKEWGIAEYYVSPSSLEQIFNQLAAEET
eukprot:TRINITY_DN9015_c0_g3_i1.p1 TRINITY_DN9015_c0_g3~~TRINITY_DN9015_c0_g3_i1.p1  ORF type:complete len:2047 (-),score=506.07 TRINITY_DN9015_c0_g3_i1:195-6335(-)